MVCEAGPMVDSSGTQFSDLSRPPLDPAALGAALLRPGGLWSDLIVTAETGSTNSDVAAAARAGAPEGLIHTTEWQSAGRGRLDRTFNVPARCGVIVSVLLRPAVPTLRWTWLPLLAALAVDATVRELGVEASLKWPNDVLVEGRKICGILLEQVQTPAGPAAVVGIGLNVFNSDDDPLPDTAITLAEATRSAALDRSIVLQMLLRNLSSLYRAWVASDGDPEAGIRDSYRRRCANLGTEVRVQTPGAAGVQGIASDIDEFGRIVVAGQALSAGDIVRLRPS